MPNPSATVVIPVYNQMATLAACVRAALDTSNEPGLEIIVVDDGSTDGGPQSLPKHPNVQVIRIPRTGVAGALNAGFEAARGRDVVRLHADVVIETPGWLAKLAEVALSQPKAGIVGARILYPDGRIQSEGRALVSGLGFHPMHHARRAFQAETVGGKLVEVDSVPGALAYYRREVIDRLGGLDRNYGQAWMEDDDFCFAARRSGYKIYVEPEVRAVHYTRANPPTFIVAIPNTRAALTPLIQTFKLTAWRIQADYWESKWGWHPYRPDIGEIRRLYGNTEVCWQIGEPLRYRPTSETPEIDCCIVTWNSLAFLKRTLDSIAASNYPQERLHVIISNNGSTDGTNAYLEELGRTSAFKLTVLNLPCNTGVAAGLDLAIMAGKGELIARLDDDILLPVEWLRMLTRDLAARPFAGCVGMRTVNDDERRSIQWAAEQKHPRWYSHGDEPDGGQADFLARVPHVAGCCVLYRRDAIKRCGLIDIRYSPTQWDDIDHGAVLIQAGYEVLCEGRLHVVHKKTSGLDRSGPGMSSAAANWAKFLGKWGKDIFELLDDSLVLSREGRCLPGNGDTSAWLARAPDPSAFPRRDAAPDPAGLAFIARLHEALSTPAPAGSDLFRLCDEYLDYARMHRLEGELRPVADAILSAANFAPTRPEVYRALAEIHRDMGQSSLARAAARRGLHLSPGDEALVRLASTDAAEVADRERLAVESLKPKLNRPAPTATGTPGSPRVMLVGSYQPRGGAEDLEYMEAYRAQLAAAGIDVEARLVPQPDPRGFDVVHVFGSAQAHQTLCQVTALRVQDPSRPLLLTPWYGDSRDARWCGRAVASIFSKRTPQDRDKGLAEFSAGKFVMTGEGRPDRGRLGIESTDLRVIQRRLFESVDRFLTFSQAEFEEIRKTFGTTAPHALFPCAADPAPIAASSANVFAKKYGIRDFVLVAAPVQPSGNQLMLLHALQPTNLPVVLVGQHVDAHYVTLCRRNAPKGSLFLEALEPEMLNSAYKAARVVAVPGWNEPAGVSAVTGAFAGCSLALSDRFTDKAAYAGNAQFFSPDQVMSMRTSVQNAWVSHPAQAVKRQQFAEALIQTRRWDAVIGGAVEIYKEAYREAAAAVSRTV